MPDHADTPVTGLGIFGSGCRKKAASFPNCLRLFLRGPYGLIDSYIHGVELMIAGHLLNRLTAAIIFEDDEVTQKVEETALFEDTP
jgi:hypothetical protein